MSACLFNFAYVRSPVHPSDNYFACSSAVIAKSGNAIDGTAGGKARVRRVLLFADVAWKVGVEMLSNTIRALRLTGPACLHGDCF